MLLKYLIYLSYTKPAFESSFSSKTKTSLHARFNVKCMEINKLRAKLKLTKYFILDHLKK